MRGRLILCGLALAATAMPASAQWLRTDGTRIVDAQDRTVVWRGMGLGGWMLQEGYMLQLGPLGPQHAIHAKLGELVGPERVAAWHRAWLDNHTTKADIDAMAAAGFNSVRLPIHYRLLTLSTDEEPVAGRDTWLEDGFARIDRLLDWSKANGMHLILDLHAAPGGQGNDLAISDRDPSRPSLWERAENRRKTVALWREIARRYANEPWIGGYDVLNEPNWDFDGPGGDHGCEDRVQAPLAAHLREITAAIRTVDRRHIVIVEGNCWGNNYRGLLPPWDENMVLSFHKYWNRNDAESLAGIIALRDAHAVPVWLGESGENSNRWFTDAIRLVEREGIGWNFWPWKKIGFNQPVEIVADADWAAIVAWATAGGPRPDPDAAFAAMMRLATTAVRIENALVHHPVIDAMLRQPHNDAPRPFRDHVLGRGRLTIRAADYDIGPAGVAWSDRIDANYHVATGGERTAWNPSRTYRNDGVDIALDSAGRPVVDDFEACEWLRYTVTAARAGPRMVRLSVRSDAGAQLSVSVNGGAPVPVTIPAGGTTAPATAGSVPFQAGRNTVVVRVETGVARLETVEVR